MIQELALFLGGSATTAALGQVARRFADRARLQFAITGVSVARTRNRYFRSIPLTAELRRLLADRPTERIDYDQDYMDEISLDLATLETIEREQRLVRAAHAYDEFLNRLAVGPIRDVVVDFARSGELVRFAFFGLTTSGSPVPVPTRQSTERPTFRKVEVQRDESGRKATFVLLDLPGGLRPLVGSPIGDPAQNEVGAALQDALSYCDRDQFIAVLRSALRYCSWGQDQCRALRQELERIKSERSFLEIELLVANRGKDPAFLSQSALIKLGTGNGALTVHHVDFDESVTDPPFRMQIRDQASRLQQVYDVDPERLARYGSSLSYVVIRAGDQRTLRYVSAEPVDDGLRAAVHAARTGYVDCDVTLSRSIARNIRGLPIIASYVSRVHRRQRLRQDAATGRLI